MIYSAARDSDAMIGLNHDGVIVGPHDTRVVERNLSDDGITFRPLSRNEFGQLVEVPGPILEADAAMVPSRIFPQWTYQPFYDASTQTR